MEQDTPAGSGPAFSTRLQRRFQNQQNTAPPRQSEDSRERATSNPVPTTPSLHQGRIHPTFSFSAPLSGVPAWGICQGGTTNYPPPPLVNMAAPEQRTMFCRAEDLSHIITNVVQQLNLNNSNNNFQNSNIVKPKSDFPIFDDRSNLHPVDFLKQIESIYRCEGIPVDQFILNGMGHLYFKNNARTWADAFLSTFVNFNDFKHHFLSQFWNHSQQLEVRIKLDSNVYRENSGLSFTDHFNKYVAMAKHLEPPYTERQLIQIIARHFPPSVSCTLVGTTTFQGVLERLRQAEYYFGATKKFCRFSPDESSSTNSQTPYNKKIVNHTNYTYKNATKNVSNIQTPDTILDGENPEN